MKKIISLLLSIMLILQLCPVVMAGGAEDETDVFVADIAEEQSVAEETEEAEEPEEEKLPEGVIGEACYTDIAATINGHDLESFNVEGNTYIIAEDLADFSFDVVWNGAARTLSVSRKQFENTITSDYKKEKIAKELIGVKSHYIYETDIRTYVEGILVPSYNINGRTIICIDNLSMLGTLVWHAEGRNIDLGISWLPHKYDFSEYIGVWNTKAHHKNAIVDAKVKVVRCDKFNKTVTVDYKADIGATRTWEYESEVRYPSKRIHMNYYSKYLANGKKAIYSDPFTLIEGDVVTLILDEDGTFGLGDANANAIIRSVK